jgi:hypothetical protein
VIVAAHPRLSESSPDFCRLLFPGPAAVQSTNRENISMKQVLIWTLVLAALSLTKGLQSPPTTSRSMSNSLELFSFPARKFLLLVIALLLGVIAVRPYMAPPAVSAQSFAPPIFFVEPGVTMLRAPDGSQQVLGKVVIDMRNGNVWGFPTLSHEPYPIAGPSSNVPTSHPFLLGKFSLSDMEKK